MRRPGTLELAVVFIVLTAGCLGGVATSSVVFGGAPVSLDGGDADRTVTVSATGYAEATPDRFLVLLEVVETAEDASTARRGLARNVTVLRGALREAGVPEANVTSSEFDIRYDRDPPLGYDGPYRATHSFVVRVASAEQAGTVIDRAVTSGQNRVDGVQIRGVVFAFSPERQRELRLEAARDATDAARTEAETLADSAGLRIVGAHDVSTVASDGFRRGGSFTTSGGGGGGTSLAVGPRTVEVTVQVTYNATAT